MIIFSLETHTIGNVASRVISVRQKACLATTVVAQIKNYGNSAHQIHLLFGNGSATPLSRAFKARERANDRSEQRQDNLPG
jgi:hypothetical protein